MAPPACLEQIRGLISQSVVSARCFDNKPNLNIKIECHLLPIPVARAFCNYLRRTGARKRIRVCCLKHSRCFMLQDLANASLLGLLAKIKVQYLFLSASYLIRGPCVLFDIKLIFARGCLVRCVTDPSTYVYPNLSFVQLAFAPVITEYRYIQRGQYLDG